MATPSLPGLPPAVPACTLAAFALWTYHPGTPVGLTAGVLLVATVTAMTDLVKAYAASRRK